MLSATSGLMMAPERVYVRDTCAICKRLVAVRKDGTLRLHGYYREGYRGVGACPGSYEKPMTSPPQEPDPDHPEMGRYNGCDSCGEGLPPYECNMSRRGCGHHCNHLDSHEECCWCGTELLGNGVAMTRCGTLFRLRVRHPMGTWDPDVHRRVKSRSQAFRAHRVLGWRNFFSISPDDPQLRLTRHPTWMWPLHPDYVLVVDRGGTVIVTHRNGFPCPHDNLMSNRAPLKTEQRDMYVVCSRCFTLFKDMALT